MSLILVWWPECCPDPPLTTIFVVYGVIFPHLAPNPSRRFFSVHSDLNHYCDSWFLWVTTEILFKCLPTLWFSCGLLSLLEYKIDVWWVSVLDQLHLSLVSISFIHASPLDHPASSQPTWDTCFYYWCLLPKFILLFCGFLGQVTSCFISLMNHPIERDKLSVTCGL